MESYDEDITCMSIELLREVCAVTAEVCSQVRASIFLFSHSFMYKWIPPFGLIQMVHSIYGGLEDYDFL